MVRVQIDLTPFLHLHQTSLHGVVDSPVNLYPHPFNTVILWIGKKIIVRSSLQIPLNTKFTSFEEVCRCGARHVLPRK